MNGALKLTNDATNTTAGANNTISVVANDASLAVGLSASGQIANTTASGVDATKLGLTVSTLGTTFASKTGSAMADGAIATALSAIGSTLDITVDNLATVHVSVVGLTTAAAIKGAIGSALHAVDSSYSASGSDVVSIDGSTNAITIHSKTTGTSGNLTIATNAASTALGLAQALTHGTATTGSATLSLDVSGQTGVAGIVSQINAAVAATDATKTFANVATANTDGTITLTANTTGSASVVNVTNNALSTALGLTSGAANNNTGADATKLKVNIDGLGEQDIDISGATTVGQVASTVNAFTLAALGGSYGAVAAGTTGSLTLTSHNSGSAGTVKIVDNAVSQALHLTSGSDSNNAGTDAVKLMISVDGAAAVGVDVHNVTDLTGLVSAIGGHAAAGSGATQGSLVLTGTATGSTNGNLTIQDNAVSRLLGLTSGANVSQAGTDATKLVVQMDGGKAESIDLSGVASGTPTMANIATAINNALHTNQAVLDGYSTGTTYATANGGGTLTINGSVSGGSLSITNNGLSKAIGLATGTADTVKSRSQQTLNLQIDGHQQVDIALDSLGTSAKLSDIAAAINSALTSATAQGYGAAYSNVAKANADGTISLTGVTASNTVKVLNSNMSGSLQFTTGTSDATGTGAAAQTLSVSIDGKVTTQVSFAGITGGGTPTLTDIAAKINAALIADTTNYGAAYATPPRPTPMGPSPSPGWLADRLPVASR